MDNSAALFSPPGRLIEIEGSKLHTREWGASGSLPPIILECGLTLMSEVWGWLAPLLAARTRVFAWDRPGLGWSDEKEGIREASRIARELLLLLDAAEIPKPRIHAGHSLGAIIHRALVSRDPASSAGMIFLDAAHPEQMRQKAIRRRMRNYFLFLEAANLLASRGLPRLPLPITNELEHLPASERGHALAFFSHPRHLRATAREARAWDASCAAAGPLAPGDSPLLVLSAQKHGLPGWMDLQNDLATLSPCSTHLTHTDATHISLLTREDHARWAATEIFQWLRKL